jgi:hypothetical protein
LKDSSPIRAVLASAVALAACDVRREADSFETTLQAVTVAHNFDFASNLPPHLAVMFSMSWFGIPANDPQGPGPDPGYGNARWGGGCVATNDPAQCANCVLEGTSDACLQTGADQRSMASRRRMMAGIYSASAQDTEGKRRVDLMLSNVRRPCDDGAKIDAWSAQLDGTRDTSLHSGNPTCVTCDIAYRATLGFLSEADSAGMTNVVIPGDDATWYFHFGTDVGLGACDGSSGNPVQNCIDALTQDATDMVQMALAHPSALRVNGNPVLNFYVDPGYLDDSQWSSIFQSARNATGQDFYAIATLQNPTVTNLFNAFDALAPWVQLDWNNYSGTNVRSHAQAWAAGEHDPLFNAVASYPGRAAFGGIAPGFDDYTEDWGACTERQLPPGDARDPALLQGEFDYLITKSAKGMILETWDDWTEGSEFEPDVEGGSTVLVALRDNLGTLFGEPADPAGDTRLADRWSSYGQARNCDGGTAGTPPQTNLLCADAGGPPESDGGSTPDAGKTLDAGKPSDSGSGGGMDAGFLPDAASSERDAGTFAAPSGCGCNAVAPSSLSGGAAILLSLRRRRKRMPEKTAKA